MMVHSHPSTHHVERSPSADTLGMDAVALEYSMAIEGPARTGKTKRLIHRVVQHLTTHGSTSLLVLCSNYYRKNQFLEAVQDQLAHHAQGQDCCWGQLPITTYSALVRNTLATYWPLVETLITANQASPNSPTPSPYHAVIFPELCGFEVSEYILWQLIQERRQSDPYFLSDFTGTDQALTRQLLRRIRLRTEHRLSHPEMTQRSKAIGEVDPDALEWLLKRYEKRSAQLRMLDNSRQVEAFHKLLETHPVVQQSFTQSLSHLVVDDVDETIPAQQHFIRWLSPHLTTLTMAADIEGGTRRGYLNAYPYDWPALKQLKPQLNTLTLERTDPMGLLAEDIKNNWKGLDSESLTVLSHHTPNGPLIQWQGQAPHRVAMLGQVIHSLVEAFSQGALAPEHVAIILPVVDPLTQHYLSDGFQKVGYPLQALTGTHKPMDNPHCQALLALLQLANRQAWGLPLTRLEFRSVLRHALKLHWADPAGLEALVQNYNPNTQAPLPTLEALNSIGQERYGLLLHWLEQVEGLSVTEQLYRAIEQLIAPQLTLDDSLQDMHQVIRALIIQQVAQGMNPALSESEAAKIWFLHVKLGMVADTPNKPDEVDPTAIVLATPQKLIDFEIERPLQVWCDIGSREWARTDSAPLYNAWVHSVHWDGQTTALDEAMHQALAHTRAAHIGRGLALYAENIWLFDSLTDLQGQSQSGPLRSVLCLEPPKSLSTVQRATLREDQAPILDYRGGLMAISAVPGAGKTFVNVELVLQLMSQGVSPPRILVLTYMDSAATTMRERLQKKLGLAQSSTSLHAQLPTIGTIHSLAFRILTDNDHLTRLGLDQDTVTILDDYEKNALIEATFNQHYTYETRPFTPHTFGRCLDLAKSYRLAPQQITQLAQTTDDPKTKGRLNAFGMLYHTYVQTQHRLGQLDFTDMIVLTITLFERYPDIRARYQNQFDVIIEDEAQDSSTMLQHFIHLLLPEGPHHLIRTGDTNQSITTTFSTADTSVFRTFISQCEQHGLVVRMVQSGRCAPPVISLANQFMADLSRDPILKDAFIPNTMSPVGPEQNPTLVVPLTARLFDTEAEEQAWAIEQILTFQTQHPQGSMAVLCRTNQILDRWANRLKQAGLHVWTSLEQMTAFPVLELITSVLACLTTPQQASALVAVCTQLERLGWLTLSSDDRALLANTSLLDDPQVVTGRFKHHPAFIQLYYHLQSLWAQSDQADVSRLVIHLTEWLMPDPTFQTIGYSCAQKIQQWQTNPASMLRHNGAAFGSTLEPLGMPLERIVLLLQAYVAKRRLPFKLSSVLTEQMQPNLRHTIQLMTLHKAKGQEFDLVIIPTLTEELFPTSPDHVTWKSDDALICDITALGKAPSMGAYGPAIDRSRLEWQKKQAQIEEEARLIYVGLTRAQRGLLLSCPLSVPGKYGRRSEAQKPSRHFERLSSIITTLSPTDITQPEESPRCP